MEEKRRGEEKERREERRGKVEKEKERKLQEKNISQIGPRIKEQGVNKGGRIGRGKETLGKGKAEKT